MQLTINPREKQGVTVLDLTGRIVAGEAGSADLSFRSAAFCCQWGTNRRPPKQV